MGAEDFELIRQLSEVGLFGFRAVENLQVQVWNKSACLSGAHFELHSGLSHWIAHGKDTENAVLRGH